MSRSREEQLEIENAALKRLNDRLRAETAELRRRLPVSFDVPPAWGLTTNETIFVRALMRRDVVPHQTMLDEIYGGTKNYNGYEKHLHVLASHCRKKLAPLGASIGVRSGLGYFIEPEERKRLIAMARGIFSGAA